MYEIEKSKCIFHKTDKYEAEAWYPWLLTFPLNIDTGLIKRQRKS